MSTVFTVATILFVRNCLKPFKCTPPDLHGQIFMVSNPEVERQLLGLELPGSIHWEPAAPARL